MSCKGFAEDTGFEPVGPLSRLVFETSTINHSDNPPVQRRKINKFRMIINHSRGGI
jgi:hypothetical protein